MPGYFSTIALMPEIKTGTCSTCGDLSWSYATHFALFFSVSLTLWLASSFDPSKHRFSLVHCCAGGAFASHGTDPVGASATPRQPGQSHGLCWDLPSFSLWRVPTPLPPHLSRPHTCTLRSGNNRVMQGNVTVQADLDKNTLNMSFAITGTALPGPSVGVEFSWLSPLLVLAGLGSVQPMGHSTAVWERSNSFRILGPSSGGCLDVEAGRTNALVHFKVSAPSMWDGFSRVLSVAVPVDPFYGWDFVKQ